MNNTLQLVEQFGMEISPQLRSLIELMEKNNQVKDTPVNEGKKKSTETQKLISEYKILKLQLRETTKILKNLAHALGACPDCWGTEAGCGVCSGRGIAGFTLSDPVMFENMIRPALIKYNTNNQQN